MVKNLPAMRETWVRSLGQEVPLEEGMATHSSILARKIECSLAGYSPWGRRESNMNEVLVPYSLSGLGDLMAHLGPLPRLGRQLSDVFSFYARR